MYFGNDMFIQVQIYIPKLWYTFDTLKRMSDRSCAAGLQDVLVEPNVFLSRGGSIPCHSWKSITQYVLAVLFVYYICRTWDESVSARWLYILWLIDIIIISKGFWYKDILDFHKGKTHFVIRRGLMRYHLLVRTVLNCFTHTSPMTDPEFIYFCFP